MKTITKMVVQKRYKDRVNIYLDDEYVFWLSKHTACALSVGQTLDEKFVSDLISNDVIEKAYLKAIHFISFRPRTNWEVRRRLLQYGYEERDIRNVLNKLEVAGVVNDEDFSRQWIEMRNHSHPRSRRLLILELKKKGVPEGIIQSVTQGGKFEDDESTAYRAGVKYARRLQNLEWQSFRDRLAGYLIRRGYHYEIVERVVKELWLEIIPAREI